MSSSQPYRKAEPPKKEESNIAALRLEEGDIVFYNKKNPQAWIQTDSGFYISWK